MPRVLDKWVVEGACRLGQHCHGLNALALRTDLLVVQDPLQQPRGGARLPAGQRPDAFGHATQQVRAPEVRVALCSAHNGVGNGYIVLVLAGGTQHR